MSKIVCFGEALIDMHAEPLPAVSQPRHFVQYAGGAPANVAVAIAKLGGHVWFAGMLGKDMFGDFLYESLHQLGVMTDAIVRTNQAKTALAFVALDIDGERHFSFYRPPAADLLFRPKHFHARCFVDAAAFYLCSNSLTDKGIATSAHKGIQFAREAGATIVMDMNFRPNLWPQKTDPLPILWETLEQADLVKLSREELNYLAQYYGGGKPGINKVRQRLLEKNTQLLIITDGPNPVDWYTRYESGQLSANFPVQVCDTTGAGDAFVGGLLFYIDFINGLGAAHFAMFCEDNEKITKAIRFATLGGALAVTRKGSFTAMPSRTEVEQFARKILTLAS